MGLLALYLTGLNASVYIQAFYRDTCGFIFDILEILDEYKAKILQYHVENPQDPSANKAMLAMTKTLKRSIKCVPLTIQSQMHNFGKGTVGTNCSKHG